MEAQTQAQKQTNPQVNPALPEVGNTSTPPRQASAFSIGTFIEPPACLWGLKKGGGLFGRSATFWHPIKVPLSPRLFLLAYLLEK